MDTLRGAKPPRIKCTYNLSLDSVDVVKRLAAFPGVATSQDAVVECAIRDLDQQIREAQDTELWEQAARDPELVSEMSEIEAFFAALQKSD